MLQVEELPFELENTTCHRGKAGIVLIATDQVTLYEFESILRGTGVMCYPTRIGMIGVHITNKVLHSMKNGLADAVNTILPGIDLDVVAFSCTSASIAIGSEVIDAQIRSKNSGRNIKSVTDPLRAFKDAAETLDIREIGLITPYSAEITESFIKAIEPRIVTKKASTFNLTNDNLVPHINYQSIRQAVMKMSKLQEIKTIFISCTNLNVCHYIDELEKESGKTILTSNQVLSWSVLKKINFNTPISGFGYLLKRHL